MKRILENKTSSGSCLATAPNPPAKGNPGFGAPRLRATPQIIAESGQALVALLIFVMMGLAIATAASFIIASNSAATTNVQEGLITRQMADSGVETAYLQILRNQTNYSGETISGLDGGSVAVTVVWSGVTATIDSIATNGNYIKKVESIITYSNNVLTQVSWKEVN